MSGATIAFLTDFGASDTYVGQMKGVIRSIAPEAVILDLTHGIPPQSILLGAVQLQQSVTYFPPGTIFLAVVDPGVGTDRRSLVARSQGRYFVGPDNGLLSLALQKDAVIHDMVNRKLALPTISSTFHGRDVFAPAAAHLANNLPLEEFGPRLTDIIHLEWPQPVQVSEGQWQVPIIASDHFGNLITCLRPEDMRKMSLREASFQVAGHEIGTISPTFGAVGWGRWLAYVGSSDLLEIAVNGGSAAAESGLGTGDHILLRDLGISGRGR